MNKKDEIKKFLPKIGSPLLNELKAKSPRAVLQEYGDAIDESYPNYFRSFITETSRIESESEAVILSYSFYLIAFIAKGYNYKLFEVIPKSLDKPYPVELILFDRQPTNEGEFESEKELKEKLDSFFQSSFFSNVVNNLSSQVDLYNDSRNEKL